MARVSDIATNVSAEGVLTITVQGFDPITIDPATYDEATRRHAMAHGFKQKYVDSAALGANATLAEKHRAIMALVNHHRDGGAWNRVGGNGDGTSGDGLLVRAIQKVYGLDRETAIAQVAGWDKPTQHAIRTSPDVAPTIAELKAADDKKAAPKVDVSAVLAGLRKG